MSSEIPKEFICPITLSIMRDPVMMPDGHNYERSAIEKALQASPLSPLTKQPLNMKDAIPNYDLKSLIENREAGKMTSCLTDEEKEQFCALCDKLSTHMERMALDLPEDFPRPPRPPRHGDFPRPDHPDRDDPDAPLRRPLPRGGRIKC